uniref:Pre-SET domain-containing protein n=1 Tax=Hucho hucho TaxID=62062 RepID=A0A4W5P345_9TELE
MARTVQPTSHLSSQLKVRSPSPSNVAAQPAWNASGQRLRPSTVDPLLIPLLCESRRMKGRRRVNNKTYIHIFYQSPCGLSLSNMCLCVCDHNSPTSAVQDQHPRPDAGQGEPAPVLHQRTLQHPANLSDLQQGSRGGQRGLPQHQLRLSGGLQLHRRLQEQLTIQATALSPGGPEDVNVGYKHKRLEKRLSTGIYECNALCRCDTRVCSNRVVQHGLQLRLQLFMTVGKSWGIRCLDDVAKGTFICTCTGIIMNKKSLGTEGNMYVVNQNHIEGAESKESYESEARCSDNESGSEEEPIEDVNSEHDDCDGGYDEGNDEEEGNHEKEQRRIMKKNSDDEDEEEPDDGDNYEDKDYDVSEDDGD